MLYLEDYLEMIEHVPQEFRDRFTEMREMDLSIQNNMDTLEKRVRTLFAGCRRGEINNDHANTEFADIKKGYNKTLEEADEKMALANQTYELVDRYLKRLDTELHKFKCELEADNKGVTELLEKRSLELDAPHAAPPHRDNSRYRIRAERRRSSWARDHKHHAPSRTDCAIQAALSREPYSLAQSDSAIAIAVAATRAITATQQMSGGRRTAMLKAAYDASDAAHDHGGAGAALHVSAPATKRTKHKKSSSSYSAPATAAPQPAAASRPASPALGVSGAADSAAGAEDEWSYDPDEPRYCVCNQVSYGDMVACDNHHCPYEWFHYPCVGITAPPRGKWYCPQCTATMRRHKHQRKN